MRGALAGDQFLVYFQPIVELATGRIVKAEALQSGRPVTLMNPEIPWAMKSKAGRRAWGPSFPKPEIPQ